MADQKCIPGLQLNGLRVNGRFFVALEDKADNRIIDYCLNCADLFFAKNEAIGKATTVSSDKRRSYSTARFTMSADGMSLSSKSILVFRFHEQTHNCIVL